MSGQTTAEAEQAARRDDRDAVGTTTTTTTRALAGAGVFGFGFSGLIDVLVLHLVLQWHHLVSGIVPANSMWGLRTNVFADGVFSLAMLAIMGVGAGVVWRSERRTAVPLAVRPLAGAALIGLGTFDLYDAIVDHAVLGLHQPVSAAGQPLSLGGRYNPHWIAISLLFVGAGYYLYRTHARTDPDTDAADERS